MRTVQLSDLTWMDRVCDFHHCILASDRHTLMRLLIFEYVAGCIMILA